MHHGNQVHPRTYLFAFCILLLWLLIGGPTQAAEPLLLEVFTSTDRLFDDADALRFKTATVQIHPVDGLLNLETALFRSVGGP
jgi:hypothetical protein